MKYISKFSKTVLVAVLAGGFLLGCARTPEEEPFEEPTQDDFRLLTDKDKYYPYDALFISVDGVGLTAPTFPVAFGDKTFIATQQEDGSFLIFVPDLPPGIYAIVMNILELRGSGEVEIIALPAVDNPQALLEELENEINSIIAVIEEQNAELELTLGDEERELLEDMVNEFNSIFASLTNAEKIQFAQYWNANPQFYQFDDEEAFSLIKSSLSTMEVLRRGTKEFGLFLIKKILPITMAGTSMALLIAIPDPTFVTKLMAIAAGAVLLKQFIEVAAALEKFKKQTVAPVWDNVVSRWQTGARVKMNDDFDLILYRGVPKEIDLIVTYRTICADDVNTDDEELKVVVENLEKFQDAWSMADDIISSIKRLFGFKGGMGNRPDRLEDIKNYETETVVIDASKISFYDENNSIFYPNSFTFLDRGETFRLGANGTKMTITWNTLPQNYPYVKSNDDFTSRFGFVEDGYMYVLRNYSVSVRYPVEVITTITDVKPYIIDYRTEPPTITMGSFTIEGSVTNHAPEHITIVERGFLVNREDPIVAGGSAFTYTYTGYNWSTHMAAYAIDANGIKYISDEWTQVYVELIEIR